MAHGMLLLVFLDTLVRAIIPGAAVVGGVLALTAWRSGRPWAGAKAAGPWLLAPWAILLLVDVVGGAGPILAVALRACISMTPAVLAPVVATLVVAVDLIRRTRRLDDAGVDPRGPR